MPDRTPTRAEELEAIRKRFRQGGPEALNYWDINDVFQVLDRQAARLDEAERERNRFRDALTVIRNERGSVYSAWKIANDALEIPDA